MDSRRRESINSVSCSKCSFFLISFSKRSRDKKESYNVYNMTMVAFYTTILLRVITTRSLKDNIETIILFETIV